MWTDFVAWLQSTEGARVMQAAVLPAIAILVAGVVAALIGRFGVRAVIDRTNRMEAAGAVAGLVEAARAVASEQVDGDHGDRRRAARLRTEADIRTRLLPMAGADLAADWAAQRIDVLREQSAAGALSDEVDDLRNRLVAWATAPAKAKRIFSAPPTAGRSGIRRSEASTASALVAAEQPAQVSAEAQAAPSPVTVPEVPTPAKAASGAAASAAPPSAPASLRADAAAGPLRSSAGPDVEPVPAWQRTRAVERLQQERAAASRIADDQEAFGSAEVPVDTAPVKLQHTHRADVAPAADADEAVRLEAHLLARHARQAAQEAAARDAAALMPASVATGAAPAMPAAEKPAASAATPPAAPTPSPAPAWLDTYDDEAQVTQNLDLKTPPPVSASSVRDRGGVGDDLVPRT